MPLIQRRASLLFLAAGVLLLFFASRLPGLTALPLHNDEGLHLTRAAEVWNAHPFWEIRDGKIINHWLIAAFYPPAALPSSGVFVGRIATLFVAVIGLAAGIAIGKRSARVFGILAVSLFWAASHYLAFYERLAFSDAAAGALTVVALWAADILARTGRVRHAILTGACLACAVLFKFTAAPFVLSIVIFLLAYGRYSVRRRVELLVIIGLTVLVAFIPPTAYLLLRGDNLFGIALGWVGSGGTGASPDFVRNLTRFWENWAGFDTVAVAVYLISFAILVSRLKRWTLGFAVLLPLGIMLVLGREIMPRHFVVVLPLFFTLLGAYVGWVFYDFWQSPHRNLRLFLRIVVASLAVSTLIGVFSRALIAQSNPTQLRFPYAVWEEHYAIHSSGYGLRDAMYALPALIPAGEPIIASMFPDSCRRANFYADSGVTLTCTDAPALDLITSTYQANGSVYVLVDTSPLIGADIPALARDLDGQSTRIRAFLRPGETEMNAAVVLWRLN